MISGLGSRRVQLVIALVWMTSKMPLNRLGVDRSVSMGEASDRPSRSAGVLDGGLGSGDAVLEEPPIGRGDTLTQLDAVMPAELVQPRDVEQLAGCAVGLGRVEAETETRADLVAHHF